MNEPIEESRGPTPVETLLGHGELVVTQTDGAQETVKIRQLPLSEFPKLLAAQDDEIQLAVLYTGKTREWFDSLARESQELVVIEGERINADFFARWFQRMTTRRERLMPGVTDRFLAKAVGDSPAGRASTSLNSAPPLVRPRG